MTASTQPRTHSMISKKTAHQMICRAKLRRGGNHSGSSMKAFLALLASALLIVSPTVSLAQSDRVIGNAANTPIGSIRQETVLVNRDGSAVVAAGSASQSYVLNTNGVSTPATVSPGGAYFVNFPNFNGSTISLNQAINGVSSNVGSYTSAPSPTLCLTIGQGTVLSATSTGGPPSGLTTLNGVGMCPASTAAVAQLDYIYSSGSYQKAGTSYSLTTTPGYSFTRASTGLAENTNGDLTSFASGAPRSTNKGLLIEAAATQLVGNTAFGTGWAAANGTLTTGKADRAGGTTAARVTSTSTGSGTSAYNPVTVTSGSPWVSEAEWNPADQNSPYVFINLNDGGAAAIVYFDAVTGASAGSVPSGVTVKSVVYPNGWIRASATKTAASATAYSQFGPADTSSAATATSGHYITAGFPMVLASAVQLSSPIANVTGSPVTRAADAPYSFTTPAGTATITYKTTAGVSSSATLATTAGSTDFGAASAGAWVGSYIQEIKIP